MVELVESSGLSERTIRYYITAGVVSPALGRGRSRYYTSRHLQELARVADLRDQRHSIDEIRDQMQATSVSPSAFDSAAVWRRLSLHPMLELHIRDGAPEGILALARALEAHSHDWLGGEDDVADDT